MAWFLVKHRYNFIFHDSNKELSSDVFRLKMFCNTILV
jgi:hypothetical protein